MAFLLSFLGGVKKACSRVQFPETGRKFPRAARKGREQSPTMENQGEKGLFAGAVSGNRPKFPRAA
jgi:hypothetical protein